MADSQVVRIPAHPSIYNRSSGRELRIDFSVPESGVTNKTGLVIFVPGFGANIDSKVYKKMRDVFSDKYNLITLQCSFFGDEFMQGADTFNLQETDNELAKNLNIEELTAFRHNPSDLLNLLSIKSMTLPVVANLSETVNNFNDMGFMQAIDIVTAIETVKIILKENNLSFNEQNVIGYGHSHGAYLLHLSNRLAPHLFSHIVDNSAWIEPVYLSGNRYLFQQHGSLTLQIEFNYLAKKLIADKTALNLNTIYKEFDNQAKLICFQGTADHLINHRVKEEVISKIKYAKLIIIDEKDVDHHMFKSNKHGLDADFLNLFEFAYGNMAEHENKQEMKIYEEIQLSKTRITVDYTQSLPVFSLEYD